MTELVRICIDVPEDIAGEMLSRSDSWEQLAVLADSLGEWLNAEHGPAAEEAEDGPLVDVRDLPWAEREGLPPVREASLETVDGVLPRERHASDEQHSFGEILIADDRAPSPTEEHETAELLARLRRYAEAEIDNPDADIDLVILADPGAPTWAEFRTEIGHALVAVLLPGASRPVVLGFHPGDALLGISGSAGTIENDAMYLEDYSVRVLGAYRITAAQLLESHRYAIANSATTYDLLTYNCVSFAEGFVSAARGKPPAGLWFPAPYRLVNAMMEQEGPWNWADDPSVETELTVEDNALDGTAINYIGRHGLDLSDRMETAAARAQFYVLIDHQRPSAWHEWTRSQWRKKHLLGSFERIVTHTIAVSGDAAGRQVSRELGQRYGTLRDGIAELVPPIDSAAGPSGQNHVEGNTHDADFAQFVEATRPLQDHLRGAIEDPAADIRLAVTSDRETAAPSFWLWLPGEPAPVRLGADSSGALAEFHDAAEDALGSTVLVEADLQLTAGQLWSAYRFALVNLPLWRDDAFGFARDFVASAFEAEPDGVGTETEAESEVGPRPATLVLPDAPAPAVEQQALSQAPEPAEPRLARGPHAFLEGPPPRSARRDTAESETTMTADAPEVTSARAPRRRVHEPEALRWDGTAGEFTLDTGLLPSPQTEQFAALVAGAATRLEGNAQSLSGDDAGRFVVRIPSAGQTNTDVDSSRGVTFVQRLVHTVGHPVHLALGPQLVKICPPGSDLPS
ncbi:hypothetical protein [Streptomyces sp. NPDC090080]|uniref:hypothetical protein n=1 Tax=Streptomyces sp. NPDC090080 TaxID=3365939 RepID=UPI003820CBD2